MRAKILAGAFGKKVFCLFST